MIKQELINLIAEKAGITKKAAEIAFNAVFEGISSELANGGSVTIKDFGTFKVVEKAAREGRNPQTGDKIQIQASKAVKFKPGQGLKEKVKYK